jgi:hypothetical protein
MLGEGLALGAPAHKSAHGRRLGDRLSLKLRNEATGGVYLMAETQVSIRIDLDTGGRIGPGKIALLEAISKTGSITAAARSINMSYRRAWLLVDDINKLLIEPAVTAKTGGSGGGHAILTPA